MTGAPGPNGHAQMGSYESAADFYDLLYAGEKDYAAEAEFIASLIRERDPTARSILDVGCGTGAHARHLIEAGFRVDGVDVEPAFIEIASTRCPEGCFVVGDMTTLDLPQRYDVVTCLFSVIGYARTKAALRKAVQRMSDHLNPGGLLVVDPWFEPGQLTNGWIATHVGEREGLAVCRMSRTVILGTVSRLEFEYLIGTPDGIERRSEMHELGLFTQRQMESAFAAVGLEVERKPEAWGTRGVYVGTAIAASASATGIDTP